MLPGYFVLNILRQSRDRVYEYGCAELEKSQSAALALEERMRAAEQERRELEDAQKRADEARREAEAAAHMEKEEKERRVRQQAKHVK